MININEDTLKQLTENQLKELLYESQCEYNIYNEELRKRCSNFIEFFGQIGLFFDDAINFDELPTVDDLKKHVEYCITYDKKGLGSIGSDPYKPYKFTSFNIQELIVCLKYVLEVKNNESYKIVSNCSFEPDYHDGSKIKPNIYFSIVKASDYDENYDCKVLKHDDLYKNVIENKKYVVTIPLYAIDYTKRTMENGAEFDYEILRNYYFEYDILTFGNLFQTFYAKYPKAQNIFKVYGEIGGNITKVSDILKMYINSDNELIARTIFSFIRYRVSGYVINNELDEIHYRIFTDKFLGKKYDVVNAVKTEINTNFKKPRRRGKK